MYILILGGTGAMGTHLVNLLSEDSNNCIFVTSRKNRKNEKTNISYLICNALDIDSLNDVLQKRTWDVIIDFMSYKTEEFMKRVETLLNSCNQYVFLSSSRVYADSKNPITEQSPRLLDICKDEDYLSSDEYALAKARQENMLFENNKKNWTIIRPYITYGNNRLQLGVLEKEYWLYTVLNTGKLVFSDDIAQHVTTITYGYDVACGIASIIGKNSALGEVFHITGNHPLKWKEVYDIYSETLKENSIKFECVLKTKTYRLNDWQKYQVIYDRYYDRVFDNSKISNYIDVNQFTSPKEGLKKCLNSTLKKIEYNYIDTRGILKLLEGTKGKLSIHAVYGLKQKIKLILLKLKLM